VIRWLHVEQFGGTTRTEDFPAALLQCGSDAFAFLTLPVFARED
jgi:hypothetical protein